MSEPEQPDRKENEHVSVRCKKRPGCIIRLDVSVKKEATEASYKKALKEVRKEISIPGFRKGKVPEELIEQQFAKALEMHFKDIVTQLAFQESTQLVQRFPLNKKSVKKVEVRSLTPSSQAEIFFEFEASPDVPQVDPKTLDLQLVEAKEPTEEDMNQERMKLRLLHATKTPIEDRAAQEGDFVQISLTSANEPHEKILSSQEYYLSSKFAAPWLLREAPGLKKGESKEISLENDEKKFLLHIESISSCTLPEENDEFARTVKAENFDDLLSKMRARLTYESQFQAFEKMRHQVRNELIRLYAFDLPQSLIEGETEARFRPYAETVAKKQVQVDLEKARKEFSDEVKRYFTLLFLLQPIAQKVDLKVQQSDVLEELTHQMMHAPFETRYMYPGLPEDDAHHRLLMALLTRKCEDWCIHEKLGVTPPSKGEPSQ